MRKRESLVPGVAVDACVVRALPPEIHLGCGPTLHLVNAILENFGVVVDDNDKIIDEWLDQDRGTTLRDWVFDELNVRRRLRYVSPSLDRGIRKRLHIEFGLPRPPCRDIEYVACADATSTRYILTEDIHFFDPKKGGAPAKTQRKEKDERRGALCQFLRAQLDIRVGTKDHCRCDLSLGAGGRAGS